MKPFIILFKPRSLDDNIELEIVYEETDTKAIFKWLEKTRALANIIRGLQLNH